ncbi:MAG: hypothetical protein PHX30_02370 [Candidatus Pacebacteria bacterium]|jgi:hypothetical protein|nr:hypothetical protein [Candidatus Paceibacterota bacterium]
MVSFSVILDESIKGAISVYIEYWWFFTFYFLWPIFQGFWVIYVQEKYIRNLKWNILEVKVPAGIEIRPKAMEEFFSGLASVYDVAIDTLYDIYLSGVVDSWFSFEIVSFEGDVHFYIRTIDMHRDIVESQIYAQYPDAEINEVSEYVTSVPDDVPNDEYDIWGTDMKLARDSAYPIRTWKEFEDQGSGEYIDPLGNIVEGVNKIGPDEQIWIQILVRPTSDKWKEAGKNIVLKLAGREVKEPAPGFLKDMLSEIGKVLSGMFSASTSAAEEKKSDPLGMMMRLSSGEKAVIDAIDEKLMRPGFETDIRYVYAAQRKVFNKGRANSIFFSYFTQFGNDMINSFRPDGRTKTSAYYFFPDYRKAIKKKSVLRRYKARILDVQSFILTSDELATLFHFPTKEVRGSVVPKVEAKKGKPPSTLPI